jgi:hypothetical protein
MHKLTRPMSAVSEVRDLVLPATCSHRISQKIATPAAGFKVQPP